MEEKDIRQIPLAALFAALGIVLPQFFHLLGLGPGFLPMFLPVMLGSMFLNWQYAVLIGFISPGISWLLTGMPPIAPPVLPVLMLELIAVALLISILRHKTHLSTWTIIIIAIIADRTILLLLVGLIAPFLSIDHPLFSFGLVAAGLPGSLLQIIIIPYTVKLIEARYPQWSPRLEKIPDV